MTLVGLISREEATQMLFWKEVYVMVEYLIENELSWMFDNLE